MAERREAGLQVQRYRVVDFGADLPCRQKVAQGVAERAGHADDVLVEDVEVAVALARQADQARSGRGLRTDSGSGWRPRGVRVVHSSRWRSLTRSTAAWSASSRELKPTSW